MGRQTKIGLDYFPLDVDFFEDEKIQFVNARFGIKGEAIVLRILARIYRNGYYLKFGEDERLLFAKGVGDISLHSCVNDVVNESVKRGLFSKDIFNKFEVLTSRGIQVRYLEASVRRKNVDWIKEYSLIDINDYINNENVNILALDGSKNPQSRVDRKEKEREREARAKNFYDEVAKFAETYPKQMLRQFYDYWTEPNKSLTKMKFELEKTWDLGRRLNTWASRDREFSRKSETTIDPVVEKIKAVKQRYEKGRS